MEEEEAMVEDTDPSLELPVFTSGQFSLANLNVERSSGEGVPLEQTVGPGFLGDIGYNEEDEAKKRERRKNRGASRRRSKSKASPKSRILREAIGSLFPDISDPGEALRVARAALRQGGEEELLNCETSVTVAPGREKIGPGNDHDDLPVYVKSIVDFIVKPEMESARYAVALRRGDRRMLRTMNERKKQEINRKKMFEIGSAQPSMFAPSGFGENGKMSEHMNSQIVFGEQKEDGR